MRYILFGDIIEENGKSIRQNNLERLHHNIPIGTLVEVRSSQWYEGGACERWHARLWVVGHDRDCDGTPLYTLAPRKIEQHFTREEYPGIPFVCLPAMNRIRHGFTEESLTPVEVTPALLYGIGALEWEDGS